MRFFQEKKWAEEFLDGKLYMNNLGYFWDNGIEKQKDTLEGIIGFSKVRTKENPKPEPLIDGMIQHLGYKYCYVCCMTQFSKNDYKNRNIERMKGFGNWVVIITNETEFLSRIKEGMNANNFKYLCGPINYKEINLGENTPTDYDSLCNWKKSGNKINTLIYQQKETWDSFDKHVEFSDQKEWRICMYKGDGSNEPYHLSIKPLNDIAVIMEVKGIKFKEIGKILNKASKQTKHEYIGNITRKSLKLKFENLSNNRKSSYLKPQIK